MFEIPQYSNPISLIPGGCPQLLDYEANKSILADIRYNFEEIPEKDAAGQTKLHLHAFRKNADGEFADEMNPEKLAQGYGYELTAAKAIPPWLNQWIPLPFLRVREQNWPDSDECRFEYGPTNWARGRLSQSETDPDVLRLVLAFDMRVEERNGDIYAALTPDDVDANAHFRLAWRFRDNAWFMDLAWVEEWLREIWVEWHKKNRKRLPEDRQFEYLASYLTLLWAIDRISDNCEVFVVRPDGKNRVEVDLVLDIGNSRTTGILVETHAQTATRLNDSYLLQLRDMSEPDKVYTEPFETRVEFSEISFGKDALSLRSGRRTPAFVWPSPVRIGPEASRLATLSRCEKGSTGMSSPKRYLWDERDWKRTWRFNTTTDKSPYVTRGPLAQRVNSSGTPLCCMDDPLFTKNRNLNRQERESAFESLFTRSSLMMFLLVEMIQQALLTINSPGQRKRRELRDMPRRLRQIIFTVPPGMPMAEQKIYKRWARWATRVLWEALGWSHHYTADPRKLSQDGTRDYRASPIVRCDWDEATCTQLVFIYNEITRKFQGDAPLFCEIAGRKREIANRKDAPSVRVATIDIGGGTTDLSITTFELASDAGSTPRMAPRPEFHDGFNIAGDDILRAVIEQQVLPAIGDALAKRGVPSARDALATLFGRDTMDSSKDMLNQRIQFVRQIAVPVSLCLLALYEKTDPQKGGGKITFKIGDCFVRPVVETESPEKTAVGNAKEKSGETSIELPCELFPMPCQAALDYVGDYAASKGDGTGLNVLDVPIRMDPDAMDETVRATLRPVLANLCEVINLYDCDALLLTGRPSRWPGVVETIYSLLPLPPGRIYPMADYRVGGWYPFSDALGNMTDPKTTVVVGAILCALAEGQLEGFSFDPHSLRLVSTARHIGEMELNGQIKREKVWFNVDPLTRQVNPPEKEVMFSGPLAVGFRQLEAERWTTTRYYFLDWRDEQASALHAANLPFRVKLDLHLPEADEDTAESAREEGEFEITEIIDRNGNSLNTRVLEMRLQTLPRDEGFWMDTGIIYES